MRRRSWRLLASLLAGILCVVAAGFAVWYGVRMHAMTTNSVADQDVWKLAQAESGENFLAIGAEGDLVETSGGRTVRVWRLGELLGTGAQEHAVDAKIVGDYLCGVTESKLVFLLERNSGELVFREKVAGLPISVAADSAGEFVAVVTSSNVFHRAYFYNVSDGSRHTALLDGRGQEVFVERNGDGACSFLVF